MSRENIPHQMIRIRCMPLIRTQRHDDYDGDDVRVYHKHHDLSHGIHDFLHNVPNDRQTCRHVNVPNGDACRGDDARDAMIPHALRSDLLPDCDGDHDPRLCRDSSS